MARGRGSRLEVAVLLRLDSLRPLAEHLAGRERRTSPSDRPEKYYTISCLRFEARNMSEGLCTQCTHNERNFWTYTTQLCKWHQAWRRESAFRAGVAPATQRLQSRGPTRREAHRPQNGCVEASPPKPAPRSKCIAKETTPTAVQVARGRHGLRYHEHRRIIFLELALHPLTITRR